MNHYTEVDYSLIASVLLGLLLSALVFKALTAAIVKTAIPLGYESVKLSILGRSFLLVEISAEKRLQFLKRCLQLNASNGFEFWQNDLTVSAELIGLHMRRWYLPRRFVAFQVRQLSAATIAELFRQSVALSGLPFSITENSMPENEPAGDQDDDGWDYVDGDDEKKPQAPAHQ
jgi:hypothetical protein